MGSPRDLELTFTGAATQELQMGGRFVRVLEASVSNIWIEVDGGSELKRVAGQDIDNGAEFSRLRVRSAVAQTVLLTISDTRQADDQESVSVTTSATITPGNTITTTADASVATVTTSQVLAARADRLSVIVKNLNGNTSLIRVGDASTGAAQGHELMPGESITLDTTQAIYVYNSDAGAQSVSLIEVREV